MRNNRKIKFKKLELNKKILKWLLITVLLSLIIYLFFIFKQNYKFEKENKLIDYYSTKGCKLRND